MNENGEMRCNDMEITYYVECDEIRRSSRNLEESCLPQEPVNPQNLEDTTDSTGQQDPQDSENPPDSQG